MRVRHKSPADSFKDKRNKVESSLFCPILILILRQIEQMEIKWIHWGHISPIWVSVIEKIVNRAKSNDTFSSMN